MIPVVHKFACGTELSYTVPEGREQFDKEFLQHWEQCKECKTRASKQPHNHTLSLVS